MNAYASIGPFAATPFGSVMETDRLDDDGVMRILDEMRADCRVPAVAPDIEALQDNAQLKTAAVMAYRNTIAWIELYERQVANPTLNLSGSLFSARERMRDSHVIHADMLEIATIGDLGGGREIRPGYYGNDLCIYDADGEDALLVIPRGLGRDTVLLLIRTHDLAFDHGERQGLAKARARVAQLANSL
ncbi:hypothetical protein [Methylobacterium sp. Leaf112]|uniref:hypothetical protein n=1 Tax=Methylobacterium sp. Leaf112 TaxID=1736258 RepID=UPI0006FE2B66|nr:hypothetical protein [Methylobacterium sp. Leaf112]KQP62137.1 hypothetical protein ASF52_05625 [Methylobacterium sp. Leaf112]